MSNEHKNKDISIFKITINLTIACLISGAIIGVIYSLTHKTAELNSAKIEKITMKSLVPNADDFAAVTGKTGWIKASCKGKIAAYIIPTETRGYGGTMKLLTAVAPDGKVINYSILAGSETPGMGDKASENPFRSQFKGKSLENLVVVKNPYNKSDIQAISGATITSRAVTRGVKEAVTLVNEFVKESK